MKDLKRTRNRELLRILNGAGKAEVLNRKTTGKIPGAETIVLLEKKLLHQRFIDELVNSDEIFQTICRTVSIHPKSFEVRALRSAFDHK